ncbi:hypothetical protein LZC95_23325 [Pendulispora brunnea]|uniref:Glutaredoxin domain-containing protein n=1 Tax=Pendulispora brunnea TaxID=2905690 RepID=A0ABZ2KMJ5_9BACT
MLKGSLRSALHRAITTPFGDNLAPVRVPKDLLRRLNVTLGQPLCSQEELLRRREARERLTRLREPRNDGQRTTVAREQAPVMVYFEKDRNARMLGRIEELLSGASIAFKKLDVAGDEATKDFVMREARCKEDDLPVVFVAGTAVGGYNELVDFNVSGQLKKAVFGDT